MTTWTATQTRQMPVLAAALPMDGIESAHLSKQAGRNAGRWRG